MQSSGTTRLKYIVAEEESTISDDAGNVVILSENWLTPKKIEAFWPSCKFSNQFNRLLQKHEDPGEDWRLISLKRKFFETDDLMIARMKAKQAEVHSEFTDIDDGNVALAKRKRKPIRPESDSSEEELFNPTDIFKIKGTVTPKKSQNYEIQSLTAPEKEAFENLADLNPSPQMKLTPNTQDSQPCPKTPKQASQIENAAVSTSVGNSSGYQSKTLHLLTTIIEQNNQILNWIRLQNDLEDLKLKKTPNELPVQLPLNDMDELSVIENYLTHDTKFAEFCNYLMSFCGSSTTTSINQILKHCMTNELASKFNFRGKNNKRAFEELYIKTAIIRAVKKQFKLTVEKDIENDMKIWLKHAPQRAKARLSKNNKCS